MLLPPPVPELLLPPLVAGLQRLLQRLLDEQYWYRWHLV